MTMRQICEGIAAARIIKHRGGAWLTAEEIFNISPSGELYEVFDMWKFVQACTNIWE